MTMLATPLRYGIIGCGSMGREHIENLRALNGDPTVGQVQVTALSDPHAPSLDAAQALLQGGLPLPHGVRPPLPLAGEGRGEGDGRVRCFTNHRDLLASGLVDAVVIASPNHTHAEILRDALATDLPILVEKPLVTRIDDGLDLLARAQSRKAITWVAQEYRYMPPVAELVRIAHEGGVGRIHQVAIREHREPFYPKVGDWNRFSVNTGGTLVEKCCHYFNLMEFILKEAPLRVFASGGQRVNHLDECYPDGRGGERVPDILDSAYVVLEYPSGARASLDLCMFAEGSLDNEHVVVVGDEGKLESLLPSGVLRHGRREDWGKRAVWGQASGTGRGVSVRQVRDTNIRYQGQHFGASYVEHQRFARAVREGLPAEIPLDEGLRAVAVGLAAHKSIDEGRVVALSEVWPT